MSWRAFTVALGGAAVWPLAACAPVATIGPTTYFASPGEYEHFSCGLLADRQKFWAERELELKLNAEQVTGGSFVNVIANQGDHIAAREEVKLINATQRAKKCAGSQ